MKRILFIFLTVFYLLCISSMAFAATADVYRSTMDVPRKFSATGLIHEDDHPPFHRLQNMMEFQFVDGKEIHKEYSITYKASDTDYGPSSHIINLYMTYDRNALENYEPDFITGTYTYYHDFDGVIREYEGTIRGNLVYYSTQRDVTIDFNKNTIHLELVTNDGSWNWDIYLETSDDSWLGEGYMDYEESPHLPSSSTQADVAAGVGISTVGIVLLNTLTKTSVSGAVSFNLSASTMAGTAPVQPVPTQASASIADAGGFFSSVKKFFGNILMDLRDMLTDEGRSYASGKVSEIIEQTEKAKD
ncbi:MAG: hypothetical protein JXQ23_12935 [Clostridia bacterium]|nr:hypothetical protein [Clostridia bacterium]